MIDLASNNNSNSARLKQTDGKWVKKRSFPVLNVDV